MMQPQIRGRHYLKLPKIHNVHNSRIKKLDADLEFDQSTLQNRLLLLGFQYNNSKKDDEEDPKNTML